MSVGIIRSTPKGRSVMRRTARISSRSCSGVWKVAPSTPMPPAADTAPVNGASVTPPIPAAKIGYSMPKRSQTGVRNLIAILPRAGSATLWRGPRHSAATPDQRRLVDLEHCLASLVLHVVAEHDEPAVGMLRLALGEHLDLGTNRVARAHGRQEPPLVHAEERDDVVAEQALGHRRRNRQ